MTAAVEIIQPNPTAIEPYSKLSAQLAQLEEENRNLHFDYSTPKGEKAARSQIFKLRGLKGDVERERKQLKADALEWGRKVDAGAKAITERIDAMIDVHMRPLEEIAQREADRKAAIEQAVVRIRQPRQMVAGRGSAEIASAIEAVEAIEVSAEVYQERADEAAELRRVELALLREDLASAKAREAAEEQARREREEAERRAQAEREARIAAEAAERARREEQEKAQRELAEANRRAREAEERAAREKAEAERKAEEERAAEEKRKADAEAKAQREREEAARREQQIREEAERKVREAEERERRAREEAARKAEAERLAEEKRKADEAHVQRIRAEAADAIRGVWIQGPEAVIEHIAAGLVPHVSIRF